MTLTGMSPTPVFSTYAITSPFNSSGHDEGIELSWQQPVWDGFGVSANYTYASGVDNSGGPLVGDSKNTANLVGYYENDWLSARLSYNYRSKMLVGLDRSSAENQDAYGTLDALGAVHRHRLCVDQFRCAEPDQPDAEVLRREHDGSRARVLQQRHAALCRRSREVLTRECGAGYAQYPGPSWWTDAPLA